MSEAATFDTWALTGSRWAVLAKMTSQWLTVVQVPMRAANGKKRARLCG
jgi:hypothetical protein